MFLVEIVICVKKIGIFAGSSNVADMSNFALPKFSQSPKRDGGPSPISPVSSEIRDLESAVAATLLRNKVVRDRVFFLSKVIYAQIGVNVVLAVVCGALALRAPSEKFFVENQAGQIVPVTPLDEPIASQSFVQTWAVNAMVQSQTIDFANWRQQLVNSEQYFTPDGFNSWMQAMKDSGNLDAIKLRKMAVSAIPSGAPVTTASVVGGVLNYTIEIPMEVTYQVLNIKETQNLTYVVQVIRVPIRQNASGLGINSINFMSSMSGNMGSSNGN